MAVAEAEAEGEVDGCFLVALAYERAVAAAGTAARDEEAPLVEEEGECARLPACDALDGVGACGEMVGG